MSEDRIAKDARDRAEYRAAEAYSGDVDLEVAVAAIGRVALRGLPENSGYIFYAPEVRAILSKYAALKASGWIAVSERVPRIDEVVIVWQQRRGFRVLEYTQDSDTHRKLIRRDGQWWDSGDRVTHWRALPDPPPEVE